MCIRNGGEGYKYKVEKDRILGRFYMIYEVIWVYFLGSGEILNNLKKRVKLFNLYFRRWVIDSVEDELEGYEIKGGKLM